MSAEGWYTFHDGWWNFFVENVLYGMFIQPDQDDITDDIDVKISHEDGITEVTERERRSPILPGETESENCEDVQRRMKKEENCAQWKSLTAFGRCEYSSKQRMQSFSSL